jgi:hypothetical protein
MLTTNVHIMLEMLVENKLESCHYIVEDLHLHSGQNLGVLLAKGLIEPNGLVELDVLLSMKSSTDTIPFCLTPKGIAYIKAVLRMPEPVEHTEWRIPHEED